VDTFQILEVAPQTVWEMVAYFPAAHADVNHNTAVDYTVVSEFRTEEEADRAMDQLWSLLGDVGGRLLDADLDFNGEERAGE